MPTIDNWRALREALDAGPTGGRWRWEINLENKRLHLVGGPYREFDLPIMDFDRWGMGGAVATLRDTSVDGMNIMHRLPDRKDWIAPFPDRAHHANWCQQVTHPDMRWIQEASPNVIRSLLDERDRLAAEVAALREDAERRTEAARHGFYESVQFIRRKANDYAEAFGTFDPDTGAFEFKRDPQQEYFQTLYELADEIEQLAARTKGDA